MAQVPRKNSWQVAQVVGDRIPDATQCLLYRARWEADAARDVLQQYSIEIFGEQEGIGVVDETGFIKRGQCSAGVKRQYSGTAGKVENCQIGECCKFITTILDTPFSDAYSLLGFQGLMLIQHDQPRLLRYLLERRLERTKRYMEAWAAVGIHGVYVEEVFTGADIIKERSLCSYIS